MPITTDSMKFVSRKVDLTGLKIWAECTTPGSRESAEIGYETVGRAIQ
jgi:hypothetical protein